MNGDNGDIERPSVDEARLDAAIDAVAREMTEFEPSSDLRARVLQRLELERGRRWPVLPRWAWVPAAALLVLAVSAAVWIARPDNAPRGAEAVVAEQHAAAPRVQPAAKPTKEFENPRMPAARPTVARRSTSPAAAAGTPSDRTEVAAYVSLVSPLSEIEPLTLPTVEPDPLHVPPVEVAPLATVPSIEIPSLGHGPDDIQSADQKKEK